MTDLKNLNLKADVRCGSSQSAHPVNRSQNTKHHLSTVADGRVIHAVRCDWKPEDCLVSSYLWYLGSKVKKIRKTENLDIVS